MPVETFFTLREEGALFLLSAAMGVPLGVIFDIFRAIRALRRERAWLTAIEDMLFFVIYAAMSVCFTVIFGRGQFRLYFMAGNLIGFALWHMTLGAAAINIVKSAAQGIYSLLKSIAIFLFVKPYSLIRQKFRGIFVKVHIYFKKT